MAFKMKPFSGFGNSPMKQRGFTRAPEGFDHEAAKKRAKQEFKKHGAKSGHGTIKDLEAKNKKNFKQFQTQKQKAKDFVKNLKPQIKKKPTGTLGGIYKTLSSRAKTKMVKQTAKGLESQAKTKMVKQVAKKGLGALARRLGPIGTALTAYDIAKTAKKAIPGLKRRAKSGNVNIGRKI